MGSNTATIMTLANSIIGVGVLAMPFCFKQCGIVLSILMLFLSSFLSRLACHFLLKSAIMARRRNFEFLAFHTFGPSGKTIVELCIIGFLMGTCIAFFVVVGDLGPVIVAKTFNVENPATLRPTVLFGLAAFVVLPLGLLRNVDSLSSICTASIGFYLCLVFKVLAEASPHLAAGDWLDKVYLWRPSGLLQCIPIFSMALFCQTQLFEIYDSLPNATLEGMNNLIRAAVNMCTGFYICVGFFGYVAFCTQNFSGNILMSFTPTLASDIIKMGFVLSVAVSFPLVIFPCRASLYSLLFKRVHMTHHETLSSHIPETRFKCLTIGIISVALTVGLLIPNIELVLGLVGSTIGVLICVMFPAVAFIRISTKGSSERLLAQTLVFIGMLILVLGTYATLYAANEASEEMRLGLVSIAPIPQQPSVAPSDNLIENPPDIKKANKKLEDGAPEGKPKEVLAPDKSVNLNAQLKVEADIKPDVRKEPPVPIEPVGDILTPSPSSDLAKEKKLDEDKPALHEKLVAQETQNVAVNAVEKIKINAPEMEKKEVIADKVVEPEVNQDAIKKEDIEIAEAEQQVEAEDDKKKQELLRKLEQHQEEQKKLLQEQKQILKELKEHEKDIEAKKALPEDIAEKPKMKAEVQHDESPPFLKELVPKTPKKEKPIQAAQEELKNLPKTIEKLGEKLGSSLLQKEPLPSQVFKTETLIKLNNPISFKDKMANSQADGSLVQNSDWAGTAVKNQEAQISLGKVELPEKNIQVAEELGMRNKLQGKSVDSPKIKQILPLPFALRNKQEKLNNSPDAYSEKSPVQQQPELSAHQNPEDDSKQPRRDILAETLNQSVNIRDILSSRGGKIKLPEHFREKRDTLIEAEDVTTEEPHTNKGTLKEDLNENELGNCDADKKAEENVNNDYVKSLLTSKTVNHISTNVENNKKTSQEQSILTDTQLLPDKLRKDLVASKDFNKFEKQTYPNAISNEIKTLSSLIRTPSLLSEPKMEDSQLQAVKDTLKDTQVKDVNLLSKPLKRDLKSVHLFTQYVKQKINEKPNEPAR